MPQFLLDENVPLTLRDALKKKGFQVRLAVELAGQGAKNSDIVKIAERSDEIILSFDADFLRLKPELRALVKVIYIDLHPRDPREAERILDKWIEECLALLKRGNLVRLTKTAHLWRNPRSSEQGRGFPLATNLESKFALRKMSR